MKAYLASALRRAGRALPSEADAFAIETLSEGRMGAEVVKLRSGDASYVVKTIPKTNWRGEGTGCPDGGEARLWLAGIGAHLPSSVRWPVVDVSLEGSSYRVLMEDVGAMIRRRGQFTVADSRELLRALARMHAGCFENEWLERAPLPNVTGTVRLITQPILHAAGARPSSERWIAEMLGDFGVIKTYLPRFLDLLGPKMADEFLALVADESWHTKLRRSRGTLLHGDLRRANIAFENDGVALIDWELAAVGPPACDVQWHVFLHYWVYPPDGVEPGEDHGLRDFYLLAFEEAMGRRIDRDAFLEDWELGWIKATVQLGYVLADTQHPDAKAVATRAVQMALDAIGGGRRTF